MWPLFVAGDRRGGNVATILPQHFSTFLDAPRLGRYVIMKNINFDWLDGDYALNYGTPEFLTSDSPGVGPAVKRASPVAEQAEQQSGERVLPFLRLND